VSKSLNSVFVKIISDMAIFLEFSTPDTLNGDVAIELMEQMAADLQELSEDDKSILAEQFKNLSLSYGDKAQFVMDLPDSFGLA
jgi:hypothetical protein